jgi:hypothetical protein
MDNKRIRKLEVHEETKEYRNRLIYGPRNRWEGNIEMNSKEIWLESVNWIHLAHDRDQWWPHLYAIMNLRVLYMPGDVSTTGMIITF